MLVAVFTPEDNSWYRAKITACQPDHVVTVHLVDFGDLVTVPLSNVAELRTEDLKMQFQAIECRLASINPLKYYVF